VISPRVRRKALVLAGRSLRLLRIHYFTLASAAIITVLFALVMTSDAFVTRDRPANAQTFPAPSEVAGNQADLASGPIAFSPS